MKWFWPVYQKNMQSLSESGVQGCATGICLLGKTQTCQNSQKLRVSTSYLKGFCSNLELRCFDSDPVFLCSSLWVECGQEELTEDTGLFTPCEDTFRGRRKKMYFFLPSFNKQWKQSNHQEEFLEAKSAFAWISALSYLMTVSKGNTFSSPFSSQFDSHSPATQGREWGHDTQGQLSTSILLVNSLHWCHGCAESCDCKNLFPAGRRMITTQRQANPLSKAIE